MMLLFQGEVQEKWKFERSNGHRCMTLASHYCLFCLYRHSHKQVWLWAVAYWTLIGMLVVILLSKLALSLFLTVYLSLSISQSLCPWSSSCKFTLNYCQAHDQGCIKKAALSCCLSYALLLPLLSLWLGQTSRLSCCVFRWDQPRLVVQVQLLWWWADVSVLFF